MHDRLVGILDTADEAIAGALSIAPPGALARAAGIVSRLRNRIDFPEDIALVAIAGGTGSGKSSLFNAILDTDRAEVGGIRPTTSRPLISLPSARSREIVGYLDWFDPADRMTHEEPSNVVLIDLPDTDSVETDHRMTVESLLLRVDAVIWVFDIEKYRDDSLHRGFLRGALADQDRFFFAINQVDRLSEEEIEEVVADFEAALIEDGFSEPAVFPMSALPPVGPAAGVEPLAAALADIGEGSVLDKFAADLAGAVAAIAEVVGGSGTDFDDRWPAVRDSVAASAVAGEALRAGREAADFFSDLGGGLTGAPADASLDVSANIGERLRDYVRQAADEFPAKKPGAGSWLFRRRPPGDEGSKLRTKFVAEHLDKYVDENFRPVLRSRAEAVAGLSALSASLADWRFGRTR